jgi:hypothetical protein
MGRGGAAKQVDVALLGEIEGVPAGARKPPLLHSQFLAANGAFQNTVHFPSSLSLFLVRARRRGVGVLSIWYRIFPVLSRISPIFAIKKSENEVLGSWCR